MNNVQHLLDQFLGAGTPAQRGDSQPPAQGSPGALADRIPGGLVGGAAAGGLVALLLGSKKSRKLAGKAAGYGGAAVIGGLAYRALQNWRNNPAQQPPTAERVRLDQQRLDPSAQGAIFELTLIKAMIAAAKADGHMDAVEQERIMQAVDRMGLSMELKAIVFDLLRRPVPVDELTQGINSLEQKAEVYLVSCLAIDPDDPRELLHLEQLCGALGLPPGLEEQLRAQAQRQNASAEPGTPLHTGAPGVAGRVSTAA